MSENEKPSDQMNQGDPNVGEMQKRRVTMADKKRYLIYYTFENAKPINADSNIDSEKSNR